MSENCSNCTFSKKVERRGVSEIGQPEMYQCQFLPPTPIAMPQGNGSVSITPMFPLVNADCRCAQYQAREAGDKNAV